MTTKKMMKVLISCSVMAARTLKEEPCSHAPVGYKVGGQRMAARGAAEGGQG
jgi:hypothetical protein